MPITIEKMATRSAKNEVLSAVVSAVSVTQRLRRPFSTGLPSGPLAASASSLVSSPLAVRKRPISAYRSPSVDSSVWCSMMSANALAWAPVLIAWPGSSRRP